MATRTTTSRTGARAPVKRKIGRPRKEPPKGKKTIHVFGTSGRPPKYRPGYIAQGMRLAAEGHTDLEIADIWNISPRTLRKWKVRYPALGRALCRGEQQCIDMTERTLVKRANGMAIPATKIFVHEGEPVMVHYEEILPPDVPAARAYLAAKKPAEYGNKLELGGDPKNPVRFVIDGLDIASGERVSDGEQDGGTVDQAGERRTA